MEQPQGDQWREYLMKAAGLGLFMITACVLTTIMSIGVGMGLIAKSD